MQKTHNDEEIQCPECNIIGMSYRHVDMMKAIFVGSVNEMPRYYHVCENCGNNFRTDDERVRNLFLRLIFRKYYEKFEEL